MVMEEARGPPHAVLLAVVVGLVVVVPFLFNGGGDAVTDSISERIGSAGLLVLLVVLVFVIRFLSSDRGIDLSDTFGPGTPDSIHRAGGSPLGVALLLLLLILFLLASRFSIFGGDDSCD